VFPQAMAAGVPIIATRVDGAAEAVKDGVNGYLVEPRDIDSMATKMIDLLTQSGKRKEMGRRGRDRVHEFDINLMVKQQEELYNRLTGQVQGNELRLVFGSAMRIMSCPIMKIF